jgi:multicomponent Na+:H+ antiporter subunit G
MSLVETFAVIAALVALVGSVFSVIAAIGVLRLPDLYTRMHAASKAGVVGAGLILLGVAFASLDFAIVLRASLGILFLLLTTPVSAHLLARAAYRAGVKPHATTNINELDTADREVKS